MVKLNEILRFRGKSKIPFFLIIGIFSAIFLFIFATKLDSQGLYYDEIIFAPAAFAFKGSNVRIFTNITFNNIPIFLSSYEGAIKSILYGLYMKLFNQDFSVISWRLMGIIIFISGIIMFSYYGIRYLRFSQFLLLFIFLLTDSNLLLNTRIEIGTSTFSLALRLIFLGIA